MIYGNIYNEFFEHQKAILPAPLRAALTFLKENDMASHAPGKFNIELDGIPMILQVLDLTTAPRNELRPEIHRKYVDVQLLASGGPELAAFYDDDKSSFIDEDLLDTERDILFYKNRPTSFEGAIPMTVGTYAMYFPWDIHVPACQVYDTPEKIRKIVIKVPIEACI
ncbi:MAG: YhcH/YjgK/YiaL family protein [Eubacteriales bacterium]|nr:YhcH/YjgK/YiaL family protein [Eubacteriales bacterium]